MLTGASQFGGLDLVAPRSVNAPGGQGGPYRIGYPGWPGRGLAGASGYLGNVD